MDRTRGEFVLLKCLDSFDDAVEYEDLKDRVRKVSEEVDERDFPINFVPTGDGGFYSRNLMRSLNMCWDGEKIEEVRGEYKVDYDLSRYQNKFEVSESFIEKVSNALNKVV